MARTFTYVVIRHGSNGANQTMTPRLAVGTVEAPNRKEAARIARERWTFYANQVCELILLSRADRSDREDAAIGDEDYATREADARAAHDPFAAGVREAREDEY